MKSKGWVLEVVIDAAILLFLTIVGHTGVLCGIGEIRGIEKIVIGSYVLYMGIKADNTKLREYSERCAVDVGVLNSILYWQNGEAPVLSIARVAMDGVMLDCVLIMLEVVLYNLLMYTLGERIGSKLVKAEEGTLKEIESGEPSGIWRIVLTILAVSIGLMLLGVLILSIGGGGLLYESYKVLIGTQRVHIVVELLLLFVLICVS